MSRRVLIAEPDAELRTQLEATVQKLGYEPVAAESCSSRRDVDAVLLEPGCIEERAVLHRFGNDVPPVVCLSVYPEDAQLAPPETIAYLEKPASGRALAAALSDAFWRH